MLELRVVLLGGRSSQYLSVEWIVRPAILKVFTEPGTDLEVTSWSNRHVTGVEQPVKI